MVRKLADNRLRKYLKRADCGVKKAQNNDSPLAYHKEYQIHETSSVAQHITRKKRKKIYLMACVL